MRRTTRDDFDILLIMTGNAEPLAAACAVADRLGLDTSDAVVLRDVGSTVVHLRPSGVVARVWPTADRELAGMQREIEVAQYLAERGGAVGAPYAQPGPYTAGSHVVTLWAYVDHDGARPLDGLAAGRQLRQIHDLLEDKRVDGLPHFARLDEVRSILAALDVSEPEADNLAEMLDLAGAAANRLDVPLQPVHGDAWLGNVLRTPEGPLWTDFEKVCLGPRELDLACNESAAGQRGRTPADDAFLVGYGAYDGDVLRHALALEAVPLTAWTYRLAARQPEYLPVARDRLAGALAGLRLG
jgi:hypothetical protein